MTIEFHCPHCDKLLKTPDDKAGVRANCPGCGQIVTVPDLAHEAAHADPSFAAVAEPAAASRPVSDLAQLAEHEVIEVDAQEEMKPCPMCGESIKLTATRCRYCGETLEYQHSTRRAWEPTRIDAGDTLSAAWETYKDQLGVLIGAFLITVGINIGLSIINQVLQGIVAVAAVGVGGAGGGGNPAAGFVIIGSALFFAVFINIPIQLYIEAGMNLLWLRVARGERADVSEMFRGGRFFWRLLGLTLLFGAIGAVAAIVILVPGIVFRDPTWKWSLVAAIPVFLVWIVLALRYWPITYVIVDRDIGVFEALHDCPRATANNYLAVLLLALAGFGLNLLGFIACFIGMIFTLPLVRLIFAVAYCGMTGQLTLRRE